GSACFFVFRINQNISIVFVFHWWNGFTHRLFIPIARQNKFIIGYREKCKRTHKMLFFTYQIYNLFIRLCKINTASGFLRYFEFEKEKIKSVETGRYSEIAGAP